MKYHYRECGLDNVWLENGFNIVQHPSYGELISITDVEGLHKAIGYWLVGLPRRLTGAEFRFLRKELDMSQRTTADMLGIQDQTIAKWERYPTKHIGNASSDRLIRWAYLEYLNKSSEFRPLLDRLTQLDAALAEEALRLEQHDEVWAKAA